MLNPTDIRISERMEALETLIEQTNNNNIDLTHNFNPWTDNVKSWLIESILIRIPLMSFYIDRTTEPMRMIDGYKRIKTIVEFANSEFALCNLEYLPKFNGMTMEDWRNTDGLQHWPRRITETSVQVFYVDIGTSKECLRNLYDRIST